MAFDRSRFGVAVDTIAGGLFRLHSYETTDDFATVSSAGYFTRTQEWGVRPGDMIAVMKIDTLETQMASVKSVAANGNATVSIVPLVDELLNIGGTIQSVGAWLNSKIPLTQKGAAGGVAPLNINAQVDLSYLKVGVSGGLVPLGSDGKINTSYISVIPTTETIFASGDLTTLTTAQQNQIDPGDRVITSDGKEYAYKGSGSKTDAASYVLLAAISAASLGLAAFVGLTPSTLPITAAQTGAYTTAQTDAAIYNTAHSAVYTHPAVGAMAQPLGSVLDRLTPAAETVGPSRTQLNNALANNAGVRLGFNEGPNISGGPLTIPTMKTLYMDIGSALNLVSGGSLAPAKNAMIIKVGASGATLPMGTRQTSGNFGPAALQVEGYGNAHGVLGAAIQNNAAGDYSFPCGVLGYAQLNSPGNTAFALFSRMDQETPGGGVGAEFNSFNWSGPPPASGHARPLGTTENVPNCLQVAAGGAYPSYYGIVVDQEGQGVGDPNWGRFQVGMYMTGLASMFAGIQQDADANYSPQYNMHLRNTGQGEHMHVFLQTTGSAISASAVIAHYNSSGAETFRLTQGGGFKNQKFEIGADGYLRFGADFVANGVGPAGAATVLPSNPTGYMQILVGGNLKKFPYYEP